MYQRAVLAGAFLVALLMPLLVPLLRHHFRFMMKKMAATGLDGLASILTPMERPICIATAFAFGGLIGYMLVWVVNRPRKIIAERP